MDTTKMLAYQLFLAAILVFPALATTTTTTDEPDTTSPELETSTHSEEQTGSTNEPLDSTDAPSTEEPFITTPIKRTTLQHPDGSTPAFLGWPSLTTETLTTTQAPTKLTRRPVGTISCPFCPKKVKGGKVTVECRENPVWCDQYEGCWYFTDTDDTLTKGCMDIIPKEAEWYPHECSEFYKRGFCVKERCLSCDIYGLGKSSILQSNRWLLLLMLVAWLTVVRV